MQITPANVHDVNFLKQLQPETYLRGKTIFRDRAYISASVQTDLFTQYDIKLLVPYRSNQNNNIILDKNLGRKRRRIEVEFAQLCDQFRLKLNLTKSLADSFVGITTKLAAFKVLQAVNLSNNRLLNQINHA